MKNIILIGMPGCGKSTIGELLSKRINKKLIDTDKYIEEKNNTTIKALFENGEQFFRDKESETLKEVCLNENIIISTGGGIIKREDNVNVMKSSGIIIFIDRDVEDILKDIDSESRPLIKDNKERLYNLYNERYNLYKNAAHFVVKNNKSINTVLNEIEKSIEVK